MRLFIAIILILSPFSSASAESFGDYISNYLPYVNGKPWQRFPLTPYIKQENRETTTDGLWVHPTDPKNNPSIRELHEGENDFATIEVRLQDGTTIRTYNSLVLGPYLAEVYSGDFNGDGTPDLVAIKPGSGNGLAAEYCTGIFVVSLGQGNGYRIVRVKTMGLGPNSLVLDPVSKSFRFIHTSHRQGLSRDRKVHSYFVHRFYKWSNWGFDLDSNIAPVWIQFLDKPNHTATTLLDDQQKLKAWVDDREATFINW